MATTADHTAPARAQITREGATALLSRIATLRSEVRGAAGHLEELMRGLPEDELDEAGDLTLLAGLRGELDEARKYLDLALRYITADPENGGCRIHELETVAGASMSTTKPVAPGEPNGRHRAAIQSYLNESTLPGGTRAPKKGSKPIGKSRGTRGARDRGRSGGGGG